MGSFVVKLDERPGSTEIAYTMEVDEEQYCGLCSGTGWGPIRVRPQTSVLGTDMICPRCFGTGRQVFFHEEVSQPIRRDYDTQG